jgi:hypothetical protein
MGVAQPMPELGGQVAMSSALAEAANPVTPMFSKAATADCSHTRVHVATVTT